MLIQQAHQGDRRIEQTAREPRETVERFLARAVQKTGLSQGGQPLGIGNRSGA
jgi:hypothetical protein